MDNDSMKYDGALFSALSVGKHGIDYPRFKKLMRAFWLPTHEDKQDPFETIQKFVDSWNHCMVIALTPGPLITVDESMALWTGKRDKEASGQSTGMPG